MPDILSTALFTSIVSPFAQIGLGKLLINTTKDISNLVNWILVAHVAAGAVGVVEEFCLF
jgi:hypothetical protein